MKTLRLGSGEEIRVEQVGSRIYLGVDEDPGASSSVHVAVASLTSDEALSVIIELLDKVIETQPGPPEQRAFIRSLYNTLVKEKP